MSLSIGKYINHKLSGVTSTINPLLMPTDTNKPFISYKRQSIEPEYTNDGCSGDITDVLIDIVSPNYEESIDLAEQVRNLLEYNSEIYLNIKVKECILKSAEESFDGILYTQSLTFELRTN